MASKQKNFAEVPPKRTCKCGEKCSYRGGNGPFKGSANKMLKGGPAFYVKRTDLRNPTPATYCLYCRQHMDGDFVSWSEWARYQLTLKLRELFKKTESPSMVTNVTAVDEAETPPAALAV